MPPNEHITKYQYQWDSETGIRELRHIMLTTLTFASITSFTVFKLYEIIAQHLKTAPLLV